jgi:hypothetical protein
MCLATEMRVLWRMAQGLSPTDTTIPYYFNKYIKVVENQYGKTKTKNYNGIYGPKKLP